MSSQIFISYRRGDSTAYAGRIYDRLTSHFGEDNVFIDVDTIEPGEDFGRHIEDAVGSCEVLIAVIGDDWLATADEQGRRRLEDPDDFVRLELSAGLERDVRVIPVLVEGARMPSSADLPADLASLARRNALEMSDARWRHDVGRLVQTIEKVLAGRDPRAAIDEAEAPAPSPPEGATQLAGAAPQQQPAGAAFGQAQSQPQPFAGQPAAAGPHPAPGGAPAGAGTGIWKWVALGAIPFLLVLALIIFLASRATDDPARRGAQRPPSFPQPVEPLAAVLPDFQAAVNSGDCRRFAQYRHSLERPSGVGPGDDPSSSECQTLRTSYGPLRGLRVNRDQTFGIAAVVDGTVGRKTVSMVWALDADRRWAHASNADRFGGGAAQVGTRSPDARLFDDRARKFVAALRARDCRTAFWLLNPESPRVLGYDNNEASYCTNLNQAFDAPDSFPGRLLGDRNAALRPLGRTQSHAFYGINFPGKEFWTLVVSDVPTNADPARVRTHAPTAGVFSWY